MRNKERNKRVVWVDIYIKLHLSDYQANRRDIYDFMGNCRWRTAENDTSAALCLFHLVASGGAKK